MSNIIKCKETKTVWDIIVLLASDNEKAEEFKSFQNPDIIVRLF